MAEARCISLSRSLLRHEPNFCAFFERVSARRTQRHARTEGIYQDENYASHPWTMACRAMYWHPRSVAHKFYLGGGSHRFRAFNAPPRTVQFMRENSSQCRGTTCHFFWNPLSRDGDGEGVAGTFDIERERGLKMKRIANLWIIKFLVVRF